MSADAPLPNVVETYGPVTLTLADGVATVLVDSPPVNAMGRAVLGGLEQAAGRISAGTDVRAVVLTGAGSKAFLAGADIDEFEQLRSAPGGMAAHSAWAGGVLQAWARLPQPVIAAVQASAVGGGLEVALLADLVLSEPTARFGLPEVKLGLIPGGGGTQRLPRRIGAARALRMMLLGSVTDAASALQMGLIDQLSSPDEVVGEAQQLAARFAAMPRMAVQALKEATAPDLTQGITREHKIFLRVAASEDFGEGLAAFLDKRAPHFTHR